MPALERRPAVRPRSTPGARRAGWRQRVRRLPFMCRAAPRDVRARRRPISPWWVRVAATAWSATERRAIRSSGRSMPTIKRCSMAEARSYIRDGAEIYRRSFAIIRAESDLARFSPSEERVAVRIIHACGMTEIAQRHRDVAGLCRGRALGAARRRADPLRFQDGRQRHHPRPPAGGQRGHLHARRSRRAGACPQDRQHAHRGRHGTVGRAPGGRRGRHRQCADGAVPPARNARRRSQAAGGGDRPAGRVCRRSRNRRRRFWPTGACPA